MLSFVTSDEIEMRQAQNSAHRLFKSFVRNHGLDEQAEYSELGPQETPPGERKEKEHDPTDPEGLSQLHPVALLRSQNCL